MAFLSKRNSFFTYENDDINVTPSENVESEVREEVELENQLDNEVATVEEESEVIEALSEQAVDNAELIDNHPEEITEEIVQESNKQYLLALGRLGLGYNDLRYVKLGFESYNTPLQNLKINQESIVDSIKKFFARIWAWIKEFGKKIKDFFVGIGKGFSRLAEKMKSKKTPQEIQEALKNISDEEINVNFNGISSFTSFLKYINVKPENITITELVNTFLPISKPIKNTSLEEFAKTARMTYLTKAANSMHADSYFVSITTGGENGELLYVRDTSDTKISELAQKYKDAGTEFEEKDDFKLERFSLPSATEDEMKKCVKGFIETESKLKALETMLTKQILSLQKKSADSLDKNLKELDDIIKDTEKLINAEATADDIKIANMFIKTLNICKTMLNEFRKSHSYLLVVLTAFVNNAVKYLK